VSERREPRTALLEAAAWIAEGVGYPVEAKMPDHPMPRSLWEALVDHIHADETGRWHGGQLTRQETASWLADEAGRMCPCGCPENMHIGEIGCPCALPDEPPCNPAPTTHTPGAGRARIDQEDDMAGTEHEGQL
jgi:hypothetical protein